MLWRIQEFFRKLIPMVIVGAVAYGGYNLYREGAFNRGLGHAVSRTVGKLPYFGSRFRHYTAPTRSKRVAKGNRSVRRSRGRIHRQHRARHHRRR